MSDNTEIVDRASSSLICTDDVPAAGLAVAFGEDDARVRLWEPGRYFRGVSAHPVSAGGRLKHYLPDSLAPLANGLDPGESLAPGEEIKLLDDGTFGKWANGDTAAARASRNFDATSATLYGTLADPSIASIMETPIGGGLIISRRSTVALTTPGPGRLVRVENWDRIDFDSEGVSVDPVAGSITFTDPVIPLLTPNTAVLTWNVSATAGGGNPRDFIFSPMICPALPLVIIDATNDPTIIIETKDPHGYQSGDLVIQSGVVGNTAANGEFFVERVDAVRYELHNIDDTPRAGNGAYVSDGQVDCFGPARLGVPVGLSGSALSPATASAPYTPTDDDQVFFYWGNRTGAQDLLVERLLLEVVGGI